MIADLIEIYCDITGKQPLGSFVLPFTWSKFMFDWKKSREQQISDTLDVKQIWSLLQLQKQLKKHGTGYLLYSTNWVKQQKLLKRMCQHCKNQLAEIEKKILALALFRKYARWGNPYKISYKSPLSRTTIRFLLRIHSLNILNIQSMSQHLCQKTMLETGGMTLQQHCERNVGLTRK